MDFIFNYINEFSYLAVFVLLIWCGLGFPLPEDIILITAGYLVYKDSANLYIIALVALVGVLGGDLIIYYAGKKFGLDILNHKKFKLILSERRLVKIEKMFNRYGTPIIFFGRFTAFVRTPIYLSTGALGINLSTFIFYDFIAALFSIPFFIMLGFYFGEQIERAVHFARNAEYLFIAAVLIVLLYVIRYARRKKKAKAQIKTEINEIKEPEKSSCSQKQADVSR